MPNLDGPERRMAFRVPIPGASGLAINVEFQGRGYSVRPVDLSLPGILMQIPISYDLQLPLGSAVTIRIELGEKTATLRGVVRRRDGNRYGIMFTVFPVFRREEQFDPPDSLLVIFKTFETQWLGKQ